jgi:hypothetical protein
MDEGTVIEPKPDTTDLALRQQWTLAMKNLGIKLQDRALAFLMKYKADVRAAAGQPPKTTRNISNYFIAAHKLFQSIVQKARQEAKQNNTPTVHLFRASKPSSLNIQDTATTPRYLFTDIDSLNFTKD